MIPEELYKEIHKNMPLICVDVILKTEDNGVLMIKRDKEPARSQWWIIGGRINKGETLEDCARRKVQEEIGLTLNGMKLIKSGYETIFERDPFGHGEGTHSINTCYLAEISNEELAKIQLDQNHSGYKIFHDVEDTWHPYLKEALKDSGIIKPKFIPVCEPTIGEKELEYVTDAVKSGWVSSAGKYITKFEEGFAGYCNQKHGIACSNGTTALHLAVEALGIGKGDEVIVPTFTMAASANAVIYAGAKPVFVDSELETWNMDISKIEAKITPQTKAIMIVHTYGHPIDMDRVNEIAKKHNLFVIEDAAEAHGAEYKGRKIGSLSDVACFSFYGNKIMTTGEGGMVVTNNDTVAERARKLRNHFFGTPRFLHKEIGYNHRMTNIQAALGLAQLEKLDILAEARRKNAQLYNSLLSDVPGLTLPPEKEWAKNVYWMYGLLVQPEFGMTMPELCKALLDRGIDSRTFFIGMHKQPCYQQGNAGVEGDFPGSDELESKGFYLPSSSHLTNEQIHRIAHAIKDIYNANRYSK